MTEAIRTPCCNRAVRNKPKPIKRHVYIVERRCPACPRRWKVKVRPSGQIGWWPIPSTGAFDG